jgi:Tfp pilus assembly protein PilO
MKTGETLLVVMAVAAVCVIPADLLYTSRFVPRFKELEKERIITSNQLATAKIVSENLKHVRELVFSNMDFAGQKDSVSQETMLFDFLTSCVNDLKMRLISVRPLAPTVSGRVTTYGYEIQLEGDYFSFGEFCSKLENSRRVLALTGFQVYQGKDGASSAGQTAAASPSAKGGKAPARTDSRNVSIKLHLDTFRVKKG